MTIEANVIVPVYNQAHLITQTIESILNQKVTFDYDILINDDCSHDNTYDSLKNLILKYPDKIKYIRNEENLGTMKNYARLFSRVTAPFIFCCDGDDYWHHSDKMQEQVNFLKKNRDYAMVHTDYNRLYENERIDKNYLAENIELPEDHDYFLSLLNFNFICSSSVCISKHHFDKYISYKRYLHENFHVQDLPMWLDLSENSKIGYIGKSMVTYRELSNSFSNNQDYMKAMKYQRGSLAIRNYFIDEYNVDKSKVQSMYADHYLKELRFAFRLIRKDLSNNAYHYLRQNKKLFKRHETIEAYLHRFGSYNVIFNVSARAVIKLFKALRKIWK